jgi:DUF2075 family protein
MILYQNDAIGFRHAVDRNTLVGEIEHAYVKQMGRSVGASEKHSWNNSLRFMETAVRNALVPDDCGVLIEYNIPSSLKRIDFIISGHDERGEENFVIVELKQWEKACLAGKEDLVLTHLNGAMRETTHPSYQAYSYKRYLSDMNEAIYSKNLHAFPCAYLHNYIPGCPEPLLDQQFEATIRNSPIFFSPDVEKLEAFIQKYVGKGKGMDILYEIEHGKIRPSRKFVDSISEMFEGNEVFTLLDEQRVAYSNIIKYASEAKKKTTLIVNGGPGTGKSVVAMNAFVTLLKQGNNIKFVAPNASFKEAMVDMLSRAHTNSKKRLNALFSGSMVYFDAPSDAFDVLLVDEAHRLKGKGTYMYKGVSQIEDIIKASKVNVFFIDDLQRIRPDDEGSRQKIKKVANELGSEIVEVQLLAQFRCSGAEGFLRWIDHNLQIEETANFLYWDSDSFQFKVFDDPTQLSDTITQMQEKGLKARLLAGYAWPWTSAKEGNADAGVCDVSIPECNFAMPWNSRKDPYNWAVEDSKKNQIGCVHTCQGLEFDYVGVLIGNDLQYNPKTMKIEANYQNYYDTTGKKGLKQNPGELTTLIKNIYRVLLSRGMKGCYVFCRDKKLQEYLKDRLSLRCEGTRD